MNSNNIISSDEDPGLRIESFAIIKIRAVTTECKLCYIFRHANIQRIYSVLSGRKSSKHFLNLSNHIYHHIPIYSLKNIRF